MDSELIMKTITALILISIFIPCVAAIQDPYPFGGYVRYSNGTVALNANITFTNQNLSEIIYDDSSPTSGWYAQDADNYPTDYANGHIIQYYTVLGTFTNTTYHTLDIVAGGHVMDIILDEPIPTLRLNANEYGLLRSDGSIDQSASGIAITIDNDVCYQWWNATSDEWMAHYAGDSYNADIIIPKNVSYFVLISSDTDIDAHTASAETVAIPVGWFSTYLRESTTYNLTAINLSLGANVTDLYAWDNSTYEWNNTGEFDVIPNQGIFINSSQAFNWDGSV